MLKSLNRTSKFLLNPHRIPLKIYKRLENLYIKTNHNVDQYEIEQVQFFNKLGLDYQESKKTLSNLYEKNPAIKVTMTSCHHNLFAALGKKYKFNNILEIGTHSGAGAVLLSTIFNDAKIETIDLPDNHPLLKFICTTEQANFLEKRNALLASKPNITFNQTDSTSLTFVKDNYYDFIWIDGDHTYPLVTIDIVNGLRMLKEDGLMACDDVRLRNSATYDTLKQFEQAGLINFNLIHKRTTLTPQANLKDKYVAIVSLKKQATSR